MSYSTLPAPSDLFGPNSTLHSRVFALNGDRRDERRSPMSEPRSPLFRPPLPAEIPPHFASLYNSPYAAAAVAAAVAGQGSGGPGTTAPFTHFGRVPSASMFYPGMVGGEAWRRAPYLTQFDMCWQGLRSLEAVVGPRTKAPREATSILKSWLNEHKDNPYPTKSEKMTLSIVTHMTLTQVSTWFANARRRIKKENKMTWTPKTRCGDRDGSSSNEEESDKDFFGRPRSPLSMSQDLTDGSRHGCKEARRSAFLVKPVQNLSQHCHPDIPNKVHPHPFLTAFNELRSSYPETNIVSDIRSNNPDVEVPEERLSRSSDRKIDESIVKIETHSPDVFERSPKDDSSCDSEEHPVRSESLASPFIQLRKHLSSPTEPQEPKKRIMNGTEEQEPKSPTGDIHNTQNRDCTDKSTNFSNFPGYHVKDTRDDTKSPTNNLPKWMPDEEKTDALASWFRDFQRLVTTGQDDRARQALAAFALAAKAEAYSDFGASPSIPPLNYLSRNFSMSEPQSPSPSSDHSQTVTYENRSFRYHAADRYRNRIGIDGNDKSVPSSKICLSVSPAAARSTQMSHTSQKVSTNVASENAPINLTKPGSSKQRSREDSHDSCNEG